MSSLISLLIASLATGSLLITPAAAEITTSLENTATSQLQPRFLLQWDVPFFKNFPVVRCACRCYPDITIVGLIKDGKKITQQGNTFILALDKGDNVHFTKKRERLSGKWETVHYFQEAYEAGTPKVCDKLALGTSCSAGGDEPKTCPGTDPGSRSGPPKRREAKNLDTGANDYAPATKRTEVSVPESASPSASALEKRRLLSWDVPYFKNFPESTVCEEWRCYEDVTLVEKIQKSEGVTERKDRPGFFILSLDDGDYVSFRKQVEKINGKAETIHYFIRAQKGRSKDACVTRAGACFAIPEPSPRAKCGPKEYNDPIDPTRCIPYRPPHQERALQTRDLGPSLSPYFKRFPNAVQCSPQVCYDDLKLVEAIQIKKAAPLPNGRFQVALANGFVVFTKAVSVVNGRRRTTHYFENAFLKAGGPTCQRLLHSCSNDDVGEDCPTNWHYDWSRGHCVPNSPGSMKKRDTIGDLEANSNETTSAHTLTERSASPEEKLRRYTQHKRSAVASDPAIGCAPGEFRKIGSGGQRNCERQKHQPPPPPKRDTSVITQQKRSDDPEDPPPLICGPREFVVFGPGGKPRCVLSDTPRTCTYQQILAGACKGLKHPPRNALHGQESEVLTTSSDE